MLPEGPSLMNVGPVSTSLTNMHASLEYKLFVVNSASKVYISMYKFMLYG